MTSKRVALVGMGPSADSYARQCAAVSDRRNLFDETWTVNGFGSIFQVDRIFHMDDIRIQKLRADAGNEQIKKLIEWLQKAPAPVYTSRPLPKEPNPRLEEVEYKLDAVPLDSDEMNRLTRELAVLKAERSLQEMGGFEGLVEFPLEDVLNSSGGPLYFNSTPAYAIAFAMHMQVESLACFGMDYAYYHEKYRGERGRACVEYWLGRAIERGIQVLLPKETWLMDANRMSSQRTYGYDTIDIAAKMNNEGKAEIEFISRWVMPTAAEVEEAYRHE